MGNWHLQRLFLKSKGFCFYCGKRTKLMKHGHGRQKLNTATADHIYPKVDIRRFLSVKKVLACFECNNKKGNNDHDNVYKSEMYKDLYKDEANDPFRGILITILKSKDQTKYLI